MDIFNMNFTGNLTADAVKQEYSDMQKTVYNFTVAVNVSKENTMFLDVAYWTKQREEEQEDLLLPKLTKGVKATIFSKNAKLISNEGKNGTTYTNLKITASQLSL